MAKGFVQNVLQPNELGDWLNQRSEIFNNYYKIAPKINLMKML